MTKRSNRDPTLVFSDSDIGIIRLSIEEEVIGKKIVPRSFFFKTLKDQLESELDEYSFCQALSGLIREDVIEGYEVRRGRCGGIHIKGLFDKHDAIRSERTREKRAKLLRETSTILIDGEGTFIAKIPIKEALKFFTHVLGADTDPDGNVALGSMRFAVNEVHILKNYVIHYCNGYKK